MKSITLLSGIVCLMLLSTSCERIEEIFNHKQESNPNIVNRVDTTIIRADYPFAPNYAEVLGSRMHYVDEPGQGNETFVLLHGQPTWSYLWRNVIPHLKTRGRVVALDLIGMGKSEKLDIDYTLTEHAAYVNTFINQLGVDNIILVIHDWGSALGFNYANTFPEQVKGIVFMEALLAPGTLDQLPASFQPILEVAFTGQEGDTTLGSGWRANAIDNLFINEVLPQATLRPLNEEVMNRYREPYPTVTSRKVLWQWPRQVPVPGLAPNENVALVQDYFENYLTQNPVPKLLLYANPGILTTPEVLALVDRSFPNSRSVNIGPGLHFVQEDQPHRIGIAITEWVDDTF